MRAKMLAVLVFCFVLAFCAAGEAVARGAEGLLEVDVSNIVGQPLDSRVILERTDSKDSITHELPSGMGTLTVEPGQYTAYVYCRHEGVPYLVQVSELAVHAGETEYLLVSLLEGTGGKRGLDEFDRDLDLALDRVELELGTDPKDPSSTPRKETLNWDSPVLSREQGWFMGDLHVQSSHGKGKESVRAVIRRAERAGLDFLAIADRNTLAAPLSSNFKSDEVVLIPAMEWGSDERGVALVYAPRTLPLVPETVEEAQAACILVQAQGGLFAIAHPCFPIGAWQWGLDYVNAVQVWARPWRAVPPMSLDLLEEKYHVREKGDLVHSIAIAAATQGKSANGQSSRFWDLELERGLQAAAIAGSRSASAKVPMGAPLTYVYAREKSMLSILEGLRAGRTVLARDKNSPRIEFFADVGNDGSIDQMIGGVIPLREETRLSARITGARGKRLEVLMDGYPIRSLNIEDDSVTYEFLTTPQTYENYRVRITEAPTSQGFGAFEMLALTSPIYAREVVVLDPDKGEYGWIELDNEFVDSSDLGSHLPKDASSSELKATPLFEN